MRRNDYFWTSCVKLHTVFRYLDPDFLLECKIRRFGDVFRWLLHFIFWMSAIYFRFVWPTDLESIPHASTLTLIIATKFEVGMCIHCRVIAFLSADTSRDLVTLTFDLLTLNSCHSWRVTWPHWRRQGGPGGPGHPQLPVRKEFLPRDAMHPRY